jgi:flagellar basal-body rod modification protein FlgD
MAIDALGVTTQQAAAPTNKAATELADTFDTFLKLLTAQLQNQDPLSPMDSAKFTEQLVQYSQVEQQIAGNTKLDALAAQLKAGAAGTALSYLGKTALFDSNAAGLVDGEAKWQYAIDAGAATATLTVTDSKGKVVYTAEGDAAAGPHAFEWDGTQTGTDQKAAPGTYYLAVTARDGANEAIDTAVAVSEHITGVDFTGAAPTVSTAAGARSIDKILRIGEATI